MKEVLRRARMKLGAALALEAALLALVLAWAGHEENILGGTLVGSVAWALIVITIAMYHEARRSFMKVVYNHAQ